MSVPPTENPFASIKTAIACTPHDWSEHHRLAWIYGIVVGWDDESMAEVSAKYDWAAAEVERLKRLHSVYDAALSKLEH